MNFRRTAAVIFAAALTLSLCGCGKNTESSGNTSDSGSSATSKESGLLSDVEKFIEADGREYGKTTVNEMNEEQKNSFFSLKATEAYRLSSVAGNTPDEGYDIIAVSVSVKNIFDEAIPVGNYDFELVWGEGDEDFCTAIGLDDDNGYGFKDYPEDIELAKGGAVDGWLYFTAPADEKNLQLRYVEFYDDDFEGSTFLINIGDPAFSPNDIKLERPTYVSAGLGERIEADLFAVTVNSVSDADSIGGNTPEDGWQIKIAEVTVENTSDTARSVYPSDFFIEWGSGDDEYDYAYDPSELPEEDGLYTATELQPGESASGKLVYIVPADEAELCIFFFDIEGSGCYNVNF